MLRSLIVRDATEADLDAIRCIYNERIDDPIRIATLDVEPESADDMRSWWNDHDARDVVLVAETDEAIAGWASLNRFSHRCAHAGIADLSVYPERLRRALGIGKRLLLQLEERAGFHKIVLHALNHNTTRRALYESRGFREVGVFRERGPIDEALVDVVAMEKRP